MDLKNESYHSISYSKGFFNRGIKTLFSKFKSSFIVTGSSAFADIDEFAVLPGDTNNDYKNQFLEFLRKNKPSTEEPNLKEIKVKKRKRRTYTSVLDV